MSNERIHFLVELYDRFRVRLVPVFEIRQVKSILCLLYDISIDELNLALSLEFASRKK